MSWTVIDKPDKLMLSCDDWMLAYLMKESKEFGLCFPLDYEDQIEAERILLRALVEASGEASAPI